MAISHNTRWSRGRQMHIVQHFCSQLTLGTKTDDITLVRTQTLA